MPFIHVTWLPKACRTASTRKEVADAIIKAVTAVKSADIAPENLVVRFSESVGGFPLPKGYSEKYVRGMTASLPGYRPRHIASHYLRPSTLAMQPRPFGAGQGTMRPHGWGMLSALETRVHGREAYGRKSPARMGLYLDL